jgi:hypothetical protein
MDDPSKPTKARPGSEEKILILSARHDKNLPLWLPDDCQELEHHVTILLRKVNRKRTPSRLNCFKVHVKVLNSSLVKSEATYCDHDLCFDNVIKAYEEI